MATVDLEGLNAPQRDAVLYGDGPLVVFAGAGSGKTRVITHRIAHLIVDRGVPPWQILAVTFTNKAAGEMRERLGALVGATRGLQVGTFHAMCARLLRWNAERIGLKKDFTIYDDGDQKAALKRVLRDLGIDEKRHPIKRIQGRINRAKQEVLGPEDLPVDGPDAEIAQRVFVDYEARLRAAGALDFGDLIYRLVVALEAEDELRRELAGRFRYQLVDEFQDTNHAQLRLVQALSSIHPNLCVVGDDDQSIYRWRGADRRNILEFQRTWPGAQVVKLEQNYRSTERILRVAHAVIRRNLQREPKEMWTDNPEGQPVVVVPCEDEREEARFLARGIVEYLGDGESLSDIAVFYRTHAQSRVLEEELRARNISYRVVGGLRFYDRAEVKDLLAYLRVIANPDDDVSLLRIINSPSRGIGKTTIGRLLDVAAERGGGVWNAIDHVAEDERFGPAAVRKLRAFRTLLGGIQRGLAEGRFSLSDIGGVVLEESGYLPALRNEDSVEAEARLQNLQELVGSMQQYAEAEPEAALSDWLADVTLQTSADEEAGEGERLTLMTVHAAKGLEFERVIVTGLEEGIFPRLPPDGREDPDELEEERRLAYVAFTRARQLLVLTYAQRRFLYGRQLVGQASRFVQEIPPEDAHWPGGRKAGAVTPPARRYRPDPFDAPTASAAPGESYIDYMEGSDMGVRRGMRVRHKKFGLGEVRGVSQGAPPRVTVVFPGWGERTIVARFLEPA